MKHRSAPARRVVPALLAALVACLAFAGIAQAKPVKKKPTGTRISVMSRNVYLGADLGPALSAANEHDFFEANGAIMRQVEATNFPVRAKGLAEEIDEKGPDLVGLQEVALWRTAPPSLGPVLTGKPEATTVKYDFLAELLKDINGQNILYKPVVVQDEFDFEAPADVNGMPGDGLAGSKLLGDTETNVRLTMRDVILERVSAGVKISNPQSANYANLQVEKVSGQEIAIKRGWASVDATVRGSKKFRFIDTHLESFDNREVVPSIRALQAGELVAAGGPAKTKLPVILVGDLNSDVPTETAPGDGQAYRALLKAGFRERSTYKPLGCCIDESHYDLKSGNTGEFDHKVDHVMTNAPKQVKLVSSSVTGRKKMNGYWDSDHNGIFSALELRR